jgi:hypothetical protein
MEVIAPLAFVISSLVIYWVTWSELRLTIPIVIVGMIWYAVTYFLQHHGVGELAGGVWLVVYLAALCGMSYIGSFGGRNLITAPWDSLVVAALGFVMYFWGVAAGTRHLMGRPEIIEDMRSQQEARERGDEAAQSVSRESEVEAQR